MARMSIAKTHRLTHKKAKEAAQKVADDLKARYDVIYAWRGDAIEFHRPGLSGTMHVSKNEVRVDCELGMLLSLLKHRIESEIDKEFERCFGKTS